MIGAALVCFMGIAAGTLLTLLYDDDMPLGVRLCTGTFIGSAVLGLAAFLLASLFELNLATVAAATIGVAAVSLQVSRPYWPQLRAELRATLVLLGQRLRRPDARTVGYTLFYLIAFAILWGCFARAMIVNSSGIFTGYVDNYADLTLHLAIIKGFTDGANFPPQHPEFAGSALTYPFLVDFLAAVYMKAGAAMHHAMFLQNITLSIALVGLLHYWGWRLTGNRVAALLCPILLFFNGGLGFTMLWNEAETSGLGALLMALPHDYTAHTELYRWTNSLVYWFVPMRSMLLGIPLFLIVTLIWWRVLPQFETPPAPAGKSAFGVQRRMIAAGMITGLLPLVHAHTFMTLMMVGAALALLYTPWRQAAGKNRMALPGRALALLFRHNRLWIIYAAVALTLALPQVLAVTIGSETEPGRFIDWNFGWTSEEARQNPAISWFLNIGIPLPVVYWLLNTGLFIPLLVAALFWRSKPPLIARRLLWFYLPFLLCFIIPNIIKIAPWTWDNIKVLAYWFIASLPLVALLLAWLWQRSLATRVVSLALIVVLTLSGGLDIWRVLTKALEWQDYDNASIAFADFVQKQTPPDAVILNSAFINHPVLLTGRRSFMGYGGRLWTHGLYTYTDREQVVKQIYAGVPEARELLQRHNIDYVIVGPMERMPESGLSINTAFVDTLTRVGTVYDWTLYRVD